MCGSSSVYTLIGANGVLNWGSGGALVRPETRLSGTFPCRQTIKVVIARLDDQLGSLGHECG
jgi:hypothetical protein